ncbi:MAG: radical SAM protein, partial [Actinomycetota bacterium]|nr:radical SAM protein [Actinomycetota bacterium]
LLLSLSGAMRGIEVGQVLLLHTQEKSVLADLPAWARLAGHELLSVIDAGGGVGPWKLAILRGERAAQSIVTESFTSGTAVPLGQRLWLYSNFHCNLACGYCCAQSSPSARPRMLPVDVAASAVDEFVALGGRELLITGGEPFLHPGLGAMVDYAAQHLPVVILTNAMIFARGTRRSTLEAMDRERVTLQVSLDSAGPGLHDRQRGAGSHAQALRGIGQARELGFRIRVAATLHEEDLTAADRLNAALDNLGVAEDDRVIRPIAAEGFADTGVHISLDSVQPEPTLTVDGAWWHPVAVTNPHLRVADSPLPLRHVLDVMRDVLAVQADGAAEGRAVFRCT